MHAPLDEKIRIIFFGTSNFASHILESLASESRYSIAVVVTQPDKAAGRKKIVTYSAVKQFALKNHLALLQPSNLKDAEFLSKIKEIQPHLIIVASYGKIIGRQILEIPSKGCINVHGSLLPYLRGASPVQHALLMGMEKTGVTVMLMDELMDHGDILSQESLEIASDERFPDLLDRLAVLGAKLLKKTIPDYLAGKIRPIKQDHLRATFTKILTRDDGKIDPATMTEYEVYNRFRAFHPWPGIWMIHKGKRLKLIDIKRFRSFPRETMSPGTWYQYGEHILLSCKDAPILVRSLQPEGKKIMDTVVFFRNSLRNDMTLLK